MIVLECFPIGKEKAALRAQKKKGGLLPDSPSLAHDRHSALSSGLLLPPYSVGKWDSDYEG
jgi:hypothetical protein